jgi:transposase
VVDHIDDSRLNHLYRIGVDEISYKRGRKFLTIVADHDTGNVIWVGKQRSKAASEEFFTALGRSAPRRSRRSASTKSTVRSSVCCAGTATGFGAPGN